MNIWKTLIAKNDMRVSYALGVFFAACAIIEVFHRSFYSSELHFRLDLLEIGQFTLVVAVLLNPKGIKILIIGLLLAFIYVSTDSLFVQHLARPSKTLLFKDAFSGLNLDPRLVYLAHIVTYFTLIGLTIGIKTTRDEQKEVIDQA